MLEDQAVVVSCTKADSPSDPLTWKDLSRCCLFPFSSIHKETLSVSNYFCLPSSLLKSELAPVNS